MDPRACAMLGKKAVLGHGREGWARGVGAVLGLSWSGWVHLSRSACNAAPQREPLSPSLSLSLSLSHCADYSDSARGRLRQWGRRSLPPPTSMPTVHAGAGDDSNKTSRSGDYTQPLSLMCSDTAPQPLYNKTVSREQD